MVRVRKLLKAPDYDLTNVLRFAFGNLPLNINVSEDTSDKVPAVENVIIPVAAAEVKARPPSFKKIFNELVAKESKTTNFKREAIQYYLPPDLLPIFKAVTSAGAQVPYDDMAKKLLQFVKEEIYGVLPDYNSPATIEQANGFTINGRTIDMNMSHQAVFRQMRLLTRDVNPIELEQRANSTLYKTFSTKTISDILHGTGSLSVSRKLVANVLIVAEEMKQDIKHRAPL